MVVSPFAYADDTCEFCREGLHTSCPNGGFFAGVERDVTFAEPGPGAYEEIDARITQIRPPV